jgi:hypothetical protein
VGEAYCAGFVEEETAAGYLERESALVSKGCGDIAVWTVEWND